MKEIKVKVEEAITSIEQVTELFYQNQIKAGYEQLEKTILILVTTVDELYAYKSLGNEIGVKEMQLNEVLTQAVNAMESKDSLLLSDILQYELKELFNKILISIK
ncbi:MAG: hypothetical protein K0R21_331 [Anaerocolumna sp.]|jgi:hypothetical protein|nr:hypothetical protein [Anaerocolumna sp.]